MLLVDWDEEDVDVACREDDGLEGVQFCRSMMWSSSSFTKSLQNK